MLLTFRPPFTERVFFQLFDLTGYLSHDTCSSLCKDLPLPSKKIDFFLRGGGVCTQTKCAKHSRIQTESLSRRFFKGFPLKFCKFGGDTKVILPTSVCLFIVCATMAGTKQIYATIICDLLVLLTQYWKPRGLGVQGIKLDETFKVKWEIACLFYLSLIVTSLCPTSLRSWIISNACANHILPSYRYATF